MEVKLKRADLLYPGLSYQIVGCAFEVYNKLGFGFNESVYQEAMAITFLENEIKFQEQVLWEIKFGNKVIAKRKLDFIINDQVVVELKRDDKFSKRNIDQTIEYLKTTGIKLAILINFGREGVLFKRLVHPDTLFSSAFSK